MACSCRPLTWAPPPGLRPAPAFSSPLQGKRRKARDHPPRLSLSSPPEGEPREVPPDRVKLAFAKAAEYRKERAEAAAKAKEMPADVKLAFEKAREYKSRKEGVGTVTGSGSADSTAAEPQGTQRTNSNNSRDVSPEENSAKNVESVSSIDFMGLDFADKKRSKGPPPGLRPAEYPFPLENLPEVEIIVGDASKFGNAKSTETESSVKESDSGLYTPKVSTWGVFPRPDNISKTYGGGRNIRPGQELETAEVKAAREARSRELIAKYRKTLGLDIDQKTRSECQKALNDGDELMDKGKLDEALPYYEKVMETLVFQSELYGQAALQWAICQDSLCRPGEARVVYEKLKFHPDKRVSKQANHMAFSFQAMQMMKVSNSPTTSTTGYENYFDALLDNRTSYTAKEEQDDDSLKQILPYIFFLLSPIFLVIAIAAGKGINLPGP